MNSPYYLTPVYSFSYQFYDEPKSTSPVEASVPDPRPICILLATKHHYLDSSQASPTQNSQNKTIFSHLPPPMFTISVNGFTPAEWQARSLEVFLESSYSPTHSFTSSPPPVPTHFSNLISWWVPSLSSHH